MKTVNYIYIFFGIQDFLDYFYVFFRKQEF